MMRTIAQEEEEQEEGGRKEKKEKQRVKNIRSEKQQLRMQHAVARANTYK